MSENSTQRAILVALSEKNADLQKNEMSLDELSRLVESAGGETFCRVIQQKDAPDPRTLIGKGKVAEIKTIAENNGISLVVFDEDLSPMQIRNLEDDLGGVEVIDRSMLILDIFALHAKTGEGKLQVELAQLKYSSPRLIGSGKELSRQGGGIGSRGPGESKLETDRRHIKERITALEAKLRALEENREIMRKQRDRSGLLKLALVGYTNAGKSTLLNRLTDAGVYTEDKLFATLDPTTRKLLLPGGETVLITDTVGLVRKLPHHLVEAFKSTLDEIRYADIILLVSDANDPELHEHIAVTKEVMESLHASDKPIIYVYNKCDKLEDMEPLDSPDSVLVSAKEGIGIDRLLQLIEEVSKRNKRELTLLIPYDEQSKVSSMYNEYYVTNTEYKAEGIEITVILDEKGIGLYKKYIVK